MTVCRMQVCTNETDGEAFCCDRHETMHKPPTRNREAYDYKEAENRARIIHNRSNQ